MAESMKSGRGLKMALAGLIVGIGFGLVILAGKSWLSKEIIGALDDEVRASCDCTFVFDSLDLSFSTLSASMTNPRLLERGKTKLSFASINAKVSLAEITGKMVILSKIDLFDGTADGAGPDSVTFRFIDQLTKPVAPENDRPGRWRVRLEALEVHSSKISEPLRGGSLEAEEVTLLAQRNEDRFVLTPRIGRLSLRLNSSTDPAKFREMLLGGADGSVVLGDDVTKFNSLVIRRDDNRFETNSAVVAKEGDALSGPVKYAMGFDYVDVPAWLRGRFFGAGEFSGTLGSPIINGSFLGEPKDPPIVHIGSISLGHFPSTSGKLHVDMNHGSPFVEITDLRATNETFIVGSTSPLHISAESLNGKLSVKAATFDVAGVTAKDLEASVSFAGPAGNVVTDIDGSTGNVLVFGHHFGPIDSKVKLKGDIMSFSMLSRGTDWVSFSGNLDLSPPGDPLLKDGVLRLKRIPGINVNDPKDQFTIDADLAVSGPWNLTEISSTGRVSLAPASTLPTLLSGNLSLEGGKVDITATNSELNLKTDMKIDLVGGTGQLDVAAEEFALVALSPRVQCGKLSAKMNYRFPLGRSLSGNGSMKITDLSTGCDSYAFAMDGSHEMAIINGSLKVADFKLKGFYTQMILHGSISTLDGYDLDAAGSLQLGSFLSYMRSAENLRGELSAKIHVNGELGAPSLHGEAVLKDGELAFSSPDVTIHDLDGKLHIDGTTIAVTEFTGQLNGGDFKLEGEIVPLDIAQSRLEAQVSNVQISPVEDANLVFSGKAALQASETGRPTISGTIVFDEGDFRKDLNPNRLIIRAVSGFLFPGKQLEESSGGSGLPEIDLDLHLTAPRNLFVATTFLGTELTADLTVKGNLKSPAVTGSMKTLRGWIGLKGNRFEITSGQVDFRPEAAEPSLEIVAEGNVRTTTGENILVIVEASGPLRSPKITLSSDRGLSHDELLLLITSSSTFIGRNRVSTVDDGMSDTRGPVLMPGPFSGLRTFIRNLTQIDKLAFEPVYSPYSGAVEPAIVARKRLADKLDLIGESTFGTISDSKAGIVYNVGPDLNLSSTAETVSTRRNTALAVDLSYTVLADRDEFVHISVSGSDSTEIDSATLLQSLRLSEGSRVRPDDTQSLERSITALYVAKGYLSAAATVTCDSDGLFCRKMQIAITDNGRSYISGITYSGDDITRVLGPKFAIPATIGEPAEQNILEQTEAALVRAVRSEGYLGARVTPRYVKAPVAEGVELQISATLQQPFTFIFRGNTLFTPEEFLDSIEAFKRKRSFGNNTIKVLVEKIERMYRDAGHFYVVVNVIESEEQGRVTYTIDINEDIKAKPGSVLFEGNSALSEKELLTLLRTYDLIDPEQVKRPDAVVPDQLETAKDALTQVYIEEGFSKVTVDYRLQPDEAGSTIDVIYSITEGERIRARSIAVNGLPAGVIAPSDPPGSISIPKINRYIGTVLDSVRNAGYLYPSADSDFDESTKDLAITVHPGQSTTISAIQIGGLSRIKESIVRNYLTVTPGELWVAEKLNATRRNLLKLGLFSRVDIGPADGTLDGDQEDLVIRVYERDLRTLEIGGGLNSEFGVHVFGEAIDKSIFSDGRSLALRLDTYFDQASVNQDGGSTISQGFTSLRYLDPDFAGSEYSFSEEVRLQRQDLTTQEFDQDRVSILTYWYRQFSSGLNFSGGHTLLFDNLENVSPGAVLSELDTGNVRLGFLSASVGVDRRDDPLIPRSGYTLRLDPKVASEIFGSEGDYTSIIGRATAIIPLDSVFQRFSLGLGFSAGSSWTYGDTEEVPITQRFYLGGRTTVRGFRENSLGPRAPGGAVLGGDTLLSSNAQLEYLVSNSMEVHTFLDGGSVFLRERSFSSEDLRWSTGVGMRYLSPIGPIGFDIGHPLDEKDGEPSVRIHFSVGSTF